MPPFLTVDYANHTYAVNPCDMPVPVVMKKGSFSYFDEKMGQGFDVFIDAIHTGSMERGTRQAVVVLKCQLPMGGSAKAYLFDERNGVAVLLGKVGDANWGADWGAPPSSIHVRFAENLLYIKQCANTACDTTKKTVYALRAGKLTTVSSS